MCQCRNKPINNLSNRRIVNSAKELWTRVKGISLETIADELWDELYETYMKLYPNSRGLPSKPELLEIIEKVSNYKQTKIKR